jgi:hypothetical protein
MVSMLKTCGCNILIIETLTTESRRTHDVLAYVSIESEGGLTLTSRIQSSLDGILDDSLRIDRLKALHQASQRRAETGTEHESVECQITPNGVQCDTSDLVRLFPKYGDQRIVPRRLLCYSDTEEKYLCLYFPPDSQTLAQVTINHKEEPGAIEAFSKVFSDHKANILTSFSRLRRTDVLAQWQVTLDISHIESAGAMIKELVSGDGSFRKLTEIRLSYPLQQGFGGDRATESPFHNTNEEGWEATFEGRGEILSAMLNSLTGRYVSAGEGDLQQVSGAPYDFIVSGYYKSGKSTLLRKLEQQIWQHDMSNVLPVFWNVRGEMINRVWQTFFGDLLDTLHKQGENTIQQLLARVKSGTSKGLSWLISMLELYVSQGGRAIPDSTGQADNPNDVVKVLETIMEFCQSLSPPIDRLVILCDEGQSLLSDTTEEGERARHIWHRVSQSFPAIRWVVAASDRWKGKTGGSGFIAKMREVRMQSMSEYDATSLLRNPFSKRNVFVPDLVKDRIIHMAGQQPCYIQTIGNAIFERIAATPRYIDIVDESVFDDSVPDACASLSSHFTEMRKDLLDVLSWEAVNSLLYSSNNYFSWKWFSENANPKRTSRAFYLDVIPGLVPKKNKKGAIDAFAVTPMFRHWAHTIASGPSRE